MVNIPQIARPGANVPGGANPPPQQNSGAPIFGGLANNNIGIPPFAGYQQLGGQQPPLSFPSAPPVGGPGPAVSAPILSINPLPIPQSPNSGPSGGFQVPPVLPQPMNPFATSTASVAPGPFARDPNLPPQPVQFPGHNEVRPVNPPILTNNGLGQVPLSMPPGPSINIPQQGILPPGGGQPLGGPKLPPIPQPTQTAPGLVPRFPPFLFVLGFVLFLAVIAEVDSMSKWMGRQTSRYTGAGAGSALRFVIVLVCLAVGVVLIFLLSALAPQPTGPILQPRPPLAMPAPNLGPPVPLPPPQMPNQHGIGPAPPLLNQPGSQPLPPLAMPNAPAGNVPVNMPFNMPLNMQLNMPFNLPNPGGGIAGVPGPFQVPQPVVVQNLQTQPLPYTAPGPFARDPNQPAPLVKFPPLQV